MTEYLDETRALEGSDTPLEKSFDRKEGSPARASALPLQYPCSLHEESSGVCQTNLTGTISSTIHVIGEADWISLLQV
jgi:hypothetical protein